jgi:hypothetical protein
MVVTFNTEVRPHIRLSDILAGNYQRLVGKFDMLEFSSRVVSLVIEVGSLSIPGDTVTLIDYTVARLQPPEV